ncbi:ABC transporter permease [Thermoflexus sp.]|uniref:ABC transporter permease n=1 Tax=Thermoflexus sp. TaxID=1969742 RepID=UPI0035E4237E
MSVPMLTQPERAAIRPLPGWMLYVVEGVEWTAGGLIALHLGRALATAIPWLTGLGVLGDLLELARRWTGPEGPGWPRLVSGLLASYGMLLLAGWLWRRPGRAGKILRHLLTWGSFTFVFLGLVLLDIHREHVLSRFLRVEPWPVPAFRFAAEWRAGMIGFTFLFLYIPIFILVMFSFNSSPIATVWKGFSTAWYERVLRDALVMAAAQRSLMIALLATLISTVLGTMLALGLDRYRFLGKALLEGLLYLPIVIPEIVMGVGLLLFFVLTQTPLSVWTILIAHVAFCIPFVYVIVRARLATYDRTLEEAAQDLGANEWETFRRITLPLLLPGILGGALMAFTLSIDDFVITFFVTGPGSTTLPVLLYSKVRLGITPELNAISSLLFGASLTFVLLSLIVQRRQ